MISLLIFSAATFAGGIEKPQHEDECGSNVSSCTHHRHHKGEKKSFMDYIKFNPEYSRIMLNENTTLINRKQLYLLQSRESGFIDSHSFYIGARAIGLLDYQTSNVNNKFGWLMRHPTANNHIGKDVSEAVLHSVQIGVTGTVLPWMTIYANLLYDPEQSFGMGTITSLTRNQVQLRKGYILLGNLKAFPIYVTLGKFQSPFGLTDTVNPFSSAVVWHVFAGLAYGIKVSYYQYGLNISAELAQGGAQFRAMNTSVGGTAVPSRLNNFVADINYDWFFHPGVDWLIGASWLRGSAYCQGFPVTHFTACSSNNPAYDVYTRLNWLRLTILGEFAETTKVWPGTFNPQPPLNVFPASKVRAFDVGAKYRIPIAHRVYALSASFGEFITGPKGAPWHDQQQIVAGLSTLFCKSILVFAEYVRVNGFVPLNFISGSLPNDPFPPGTTHSQGDVHNNVFVVGIDATI